MTSKSPLHLITEAHDETYFALQGLAQLTDTVLLGQVTEIRDRLERATAKMTQVVGIVEGNEPPKTGE